eukprot:467428-Pelagomonas_calceolata.AAC.4
MTRLVEVSLCAYSTEWAWSFLASLVDLDGFIPSSELIKGMGSLDLNMNMIMEDSKTKSMPCTLMILIILFPKSWILCIWLAQSRRPSSRTTWLKVKSRRNLLSPCRQAMKATNGRLRPCSYKGVLHARVSREVRLEWACSPNHRSKAPTCVMLMEPTKQAAIIYRQTSTHYDCAYQQLFANYEACLRFMTLVLPPPPPPPPPPRCGRRASIHQNVHTPLRKKQLAS